MKRVLALCCILPLWLCACAEQRAVSPDAAFSCDFTAVFSDLTVVGGVTRETDGTLTMTFSAPPTLEGATLCRSGGKTTLSEGGLVLTLPTAEDPDGQAVNSDLCRLLAAVMDSLDPAAGRTEEGTVIFSGRAAGLSFTLRSDAATGALLSLDLPEIPLYMEFRAAEEKVDT